MTYGYVIKDVPIDLASFESIGYVLLHAKETC